MKSLLVDRVRRNAWVRTVAVLWLVTLSATSLAQEPRVVETRSMAEVATIRGKLELRRFDMEDGSFWYQIVLEDKVLSTEPRHQSVYIDSSHPKTGPARVVLLGLPRGNSCPSFYSVLEIKEDGSTVRSEKFGNCVDDPRTSFTRGVLRMDFRKVNLTPAESWTYQNGKVSKVPSTRRK